MDNELEITQPIDLDHLSRAGEERRGEWYAKPDDIIRLEQEIERCARRKARAPFRMGYKRSGFTLN